MSAAVVLAGIAKSYQKNVPVLHPLNLEIKAGELFFLLGPSGCGKSTLLRIIAGLLAPSAGRILFDGGDITSLAPEKRQTAMVFQNYALWPHLSVFDNVAFGLRAAHVPARELKRRVGEALKLVRMTEFAFRRIPSLSGGQQQRIALARAVVVEPRVLLLDEPLSNLDAKLRDEMRLEISRICRERKLTAIYVTHDRREALSMGDRIALLDQGVIQQIGTPVELYNRPRNRFAAAFLGGVNFIPGENTAAGFHTAFGAFPAAGRGKTLLIRPEALEIVSPGLAGNGHCFPAKFLSGTFLGERSELKFQTGDGTVLEAAVAAYGELTPGQTYLLRVEPRHLALLED